MASSADYRCRLCEQVMEFVFDGTPPATHTLPDRHWVHDDEGKIDCKGAFDRVWTAPHLGRMSSGEPAR